MLQISETILLPRDEFVAVYWMPTSPYYKVIGIDFVFLVRDEDNHQWLVAEAQTDHGSVLFEHAENYVGFSRSQGVKDNGKMRVKELPKGALARLIRQAIEIGQSVERQIEEFTTPQGDNDGDKEENDTH